MEHSSHKNLNKCSRRLELCSKAKRSWLCGLGLSDYKYHCANSYIIYIMLNTKNRCGTSFNIR